MAEMVVYGSHRDLEEVMLLSAKRRFDSDYSPELMTFIYRRWPRTRGHIGQVRLEIWRAEGGK